MWRRVKLGDVCTIINGGTPKSTVKNYWDGDIKWLTPKDMGKLQDKYVRNTERRITADGLTNSSAKLVPKNSIILSCRAPIGHVFINECVISFNQGCKGLIPTQDLLVEYLYYFLFASKKLLNDLGTGTTFKEISGKTLSNVTIALPPLAEQQRIVAKLDAAFAEVDSAIELQKKRIESSIRIFESHLSEIFSQAAYSWTKASLKEITTKIGSGATPKGGQASYKDEGISLIRSMNVHDLKMVPKDLAKIDDVQAAKLSNVSVEENDVLLNITGASVARCALVDSRMLPARVNQHVAIIRLEKQLLNPKLLCYMLVSNLYKDKLLAVGESGGSTRQAITKKQIEEFEITFPNTVEEQKLLMSILDELNAQTQKLASIYRQQCQHTSALKNAILIHELQPSEAA